jgi:hypothetical protein
VKAAIIDEHITFELNTILIILCFDILGIRSGAVSVSLLSEL